MAADTPLTPPSVIPPALDPLVASHEADNYEAELKACFVEVFEAMIRPAERRINSYGAPHRGAFATIERAVKAEGLAMERKTQGQAYMAELYRAWRSHNPKRGTAFLRHYLQLLWPNQWTMAQLWQDPSRRYPAATSEVERSGWFLTSRIRVNLDVADVSDLARLVGSFRAVLPARFVLDMTVKGGFNGGVRIASAAQQAQVQRFDGATTATAQGSGAQGALPAWGAVASQVGQIGVASPDLALAAVVTGGAPPYRFAVAGGALPGGLTLSTATGIVSGTPTALGSFAAAFTVVDSRGTPATSGSVSFAVQAAAMTWLPLPDVAGTVGQPLTLDLALNLSGGAPPYVFSLSGGTLPAGVTLDAATGVVSGTPTAGGNLAPTFVAVDALGVSSPPAAASFAVAWPALVWSAVPTVPSLLTGTAFVLELAPLVTGGAPPRTFALASGTLPAGLALDAATGAISGMPTTAGSASAAFRVTDAAGSSATSAAVSFAIAATLSWVQIPAQTAATGTAGSLALAPLVSGGAAPYTFTLASGALPAGVALNAGTGVVSGTPTVAGSYSAAFTVTDALGATATSAVASWTVLPPAPFWLVIPAQSLKVGTAFSLSLAPLVSGGLAPFTYSLRTGVLPSGVTLNTSTGVIAGTPTAAGSWPAVGLRVTDAAGRQGDSATFGFTVAASIAWSGVPTTMSAPIGQAASIPLAGYVSGGTAPFTFSVLAGTLPSGLTLGAASGAITGTPSTGGSWTGISIRVVDATGATASTPAFTFTVAAASTLRWDPLPSAYPLTAYNTIAVYVGSLVTGGQPPYVFSLAAGFELPTGLYFDSYGSIGGAATVRGQSKVAVFAATDALGAVANSTAITFNVAP